MEQLIWLALAAPLLGFIVLMLFGQSLPRVLVGVIACLTILWAFGCFSVLTANYIQSGMHPIQAKLYSWIPVKGVDANFSTTLDALSLMMTLIITGVGFLIHVYSIGYMEHDHAPARYFACMNFFVLAMLLLVLADNLLLLFVGWEGVGLASYLLIGYWYEKTSAARAAYKAFVVNRIGDFGFLLGILILLTIFGTGNIATLNEQAPQHFAQGAPLVTALTLLLFLGACGKSAQLPLHVWLPDAMEGPTPVSALIHAATMVTAGVYLIVRLHPIFDLAPDTLMVVGTVGGVTSLYASFCALGQTDLKRVLAYSTVSQLGLMFLACGVGAYYAAMFHLMAHAFVKALLFLSAGNVVHMLHDTTDMRQMGGLNKIFTKSHWLFLIGAIALAGVPPLSVFFSKELILEQEYLSGDLVLYAVGLAASILTGVYMIRAYCLTFTGPSRSDPHLLEGVHEAPKVMLLPVSLLALLAIFGGALGFTPGGDALLESFLTYVDVTVPHPEHGWGVFLETPSLIAMCGVTLGVLLTAWIYLTKQDTLGRTWRWLTQSFYVDAFYNLFFVTPIKAIGQLLSQRVEPLIFFGSMKACGALTQRMAGALQLLQSGQIRAYIAWMIFGAALLILYLAV